MKKQKSKSKGSIETFPNVSANSPDLADIMDRLYRWNPEATLADVRWEMEVIEEAIWLAEEEYGANAALAVMR